MATQPTYPSRRAPARNLKTASHARGELESFDDTTYLGTTAPGDHGVATRGYKITAPAASASTIADTLGFDVYHLDGDTYVAAFPVT
jgi:hypothetical protein